MKKFNIYGVTKNITPINIVSALDSVRYSPESNKIVYSGKEGRPLTRTVRKKFLLSGSSFIVEDENGIELEKSSIAEIPVIPSTKIRGALRREASSIVEDYLVNEKQTKLSYQVYMGMRVGAVSGRPDGKPSTSTEIVKARSHVMLGIFGGGPRMIKGNLRVSDALPVLDQLIEEGIISQSFYDKSAKGLKPRDLLSYTQVVRSDDFSPNSTHRTAMVIEDFNATFDSLRSDLLMRQKEKAEGVDSDDRSIQSFTFREDVVAGVPFLFNFSLDGTDAQLGLFISALERTFNNSGFSGKSSLNFGKFVGSIYVKDELGNDLEVLTSDDSGHFSISQAATPFLSSMTEDLESLSYEDLVSFMAPTTKG